MEVYEKKCLELGVIDLQKRKMMSEVEPKKEKKKRRIGPAIGPQRGPASTAKPAANANGAGEAIKEDPKNNAGEQCVEGIPPKRSVIGPSLPSKLSSNE
jgi:hypothetical protein